MSRRSTFSKKDGPEAKLAKALRPLLLAGITAAGFTLLAVLGAGLARAREEERLTGAFFSAAGVEARVARLRLRAAAIFSCCCWWDRGEGANGPFARHF